jgi:hypothetical protein
MKGIIFAGCSFTWGQGLEYYSDLNDKTFVQFNGWPGITRISHFEYIKNNRFAKKVSTHFNTFDVCRYQNGGSEDASIKFVLDILNENVDKKVNEFQKDDFSYLIFQTSEPTRNTYTYMDYELNVEKEISIKDFIDDTRNPKYCSFYEYIERNFSNNFELFYNHFLETTFNKIKELFRLCDIVGIKCFIINWRYDYISLIERNYMVDKLITIDYNNKNYKCIFDLMQHNLEKFDISADINIPENKDNHPTPFAHKIIADSIIKKIEEYEQYTIHSV